MVALGLLIAVTDISSVNWKGLLILGVGTPTSIFLHGFFDELKIHHKKYYDQTSLEIFQ